MNFIARVLLGNFIRKRWAEGSARRGRGRGRGRYPTAFGRPRGRTQVRVRGCCLPIPLGALGITALGISRLFSAAR
jgi:hypothetical protein